MKQDMCVPCDEGILNIRVGGIIMRDGKLLMVGNDRSDYLYSVGGRIKFGETAEEAIVREILEETGVKMEIDRLGFVHENYFYGDAPANLGKLIYEISFFFYMKVPQDFAPVSESFTEGQSKEYLKWVSLDEDIQMYPTFFRSELQNPENTVKHFVTDER
jgi:ADP-ribose pyrophosphatase YjhB (NUDIX family)